MVLDEQAVLLKVLPLIELHIHELPLLVLTVGLRAGAAAAAPGHGAAR